MSEHSMPCDRDHAHQARFQWEKRLRSGLGFMAKPSTGSEGPWAPAFVHFPVHSQTLFQETNSF